MDNATIIDAVGTDNKAADCPAPQAADCADMPQARRSCLNCGKALASGAHYCTECGQWAYTGRLGSKDLAINSLGTLTRLNKGVFYTCYNLLCRPWRVISGYIKGQRVNYTDPVKLLIGLCFILIALKAMFDLGDSQGAQVAVEGQTERTLFEHFWQFFLHSDTLQYLVAFLPVAPVVMLANRKGKALRYNFAECAIGSLYMSDAALIIEVLCLPLLAFGVNISGYLILGYLTVMGSVTIYKSFNHLGYSHQRRMLKTISTIILIALAYILTLLLILLITILIVISLGGID